MHRYRLFRFQPCLLLLLVAIGVPSHGCGMGNGGVLHPGHVSYIISVSERVYVCSGYTKAMTVNGRRAVHVRRTFQPGVRVTFPVLVPDKKAERIRSTPSCRKPCASLLKRRDGRTGQRLRSAVSRKKKFFAGETVCWPGSNRPLFLHTDDVPCSCSRCHQPHLNIAVCLSYRLPETY